MYGCGDVNSLLVRFQSSSLSTRPYGSIHTRHANFETNLANFGTICLELEKVESSCSREAKVLHIARVFVCVCISFGVSGENTPTMFPFLFPSEAKIKGFYLFTISLLLRGNSPPHAHKGSSRTLLRTEAN